LARVLVTGGAGFIGSHLVDRLLAEGHEVAVIDNLKTGKRANVNPQARFHEVDLTDPEATASVLNAELPQFVHHLAAQAGVRLSLVDPAYDARVNLIGGLNLLEACRAIGVERVVYSSSGGAIYGEKEQLPIPEDVEIVPISPYGVSKYAFELYLRAANIVWDLDYVVVRYANVYGPRQDPHGEAGVVSIFVDAMLDGRRPSIFGDGEQTRDYVHVSDVVRANVSAMTAPALRAYNVGTGIRTSVRELYDAIAAAVGFSEEPLYEEARPGEVRHTSVDASRLTSATGWRPEMDLRAGVRNTVDHFRAQRRS
jgi:UDP-glucose 4-epimerase